MRGTCLTLLALLVGGCNSHGISTDTDPPQAAGVASNRASDGTKTPPALGTHEVDGVRVELLGIDVGDGDTIQIRWRYLNDTAEERILAGGVNQTDVDVLLTRDAFLVDEAHQKKYLVVRDENSDPVASRHGGPEWAAIGPGETVNAWAKFPAPPEDTSVVSVHLPGVPPFEDVRLPERP